ncbi:MAG: GNAT family N-acetyltransferase [Candidatus Thorarchaeota archaeon]
MEIELARKEDTSKLVEYLKRNEETDYDNFIEKRISYFLENNLIVLAKEDNKIIGQAFIQIKENPELGVAEFETVEIHENYRGKGIGTELIKKSVDYTKEYFVKKNVKPRCLYLLTRSNNLAAHKIYEKAGFKKINTIGKIFKEDEPEELVMALFI